MPIYEYECRECRHRLEKLQKISDEPLVDCPECGRPALAKLVSAAGFRLKGGGWYETDFKDKRKRNLAGDSDAKSGDGKGEGKRDGDGGGKPASSGGADSGASKKSGSSDTKAASTAA
jgi:putative FmdB family regulatory protein